MHIYGIQKDGTDEFICREAMEKQIQRKDLWKRAGGREGKMYGESNMETTQMSMDKDEWIKKWWYTYRIEYYSAIKRMHLNQF